MSNAAIIILGLAVCLVLGFLDEWIQQRSRRKRGTKLYGMPRVIAVIHWDTQLGAPVRSLIAFGYKASTVGMPHAPLAVVFQRGNEPVQMAAVGDELYWDGIRVTVREQSKAD